MNFFKNCLLISPLSSSVGFIYILNMMINQIIYIIHGDEIQHPSLTCSIAVSRDSYLMLYVILFSQKSQNSQTLSIFRPSKSNPLVKVFYIKGSKPIYYGIRFYCIYSLQRQKSIEMLGIDLSTCFLKLSTASFNILKTLIVPSISIHLLPMAIIIVPRNIHPLSSIYRLIIGMEVKSTFQNYIDPRDPLDESKELTTLMSYSSYMGRKLFYLFYSMLIKFLKQ